MRNWLSAGVAAAMMLGDVAAAQAPPPPKPPGILPSQPAGDICPPGGRNVTDDFAPAPAFAGQTRAPRSEPSAGYRVDVVATLERPRSIYPMPGGAVLAIDARRRLRIVAADGKLSAPIAGVPEFEMPAPQAGLMDVAVDPGFAKNRVLYLAYVTGKTPEAGVPSSNLLGRIVRAKLSADGSALQDVKQIYEGGRVRRLLPQADGTLMFINAFADTGQGPEADVPQRLDQPYGKVMRINADGSIPKSNPFLSRPGAKPETYAYGLRDPDGLASDARGRVWFVEHEVRGGDELDLVGAGKNYGYPTIGYGRANSGELQYGGATVQAGMEQPVYYWTPAVGPSGLMVYSGKMFPAWRGNLFAGGLVAQSLIRLTLKNDKVASEEFMLARTCKRIRDVREAADGSILMITDYADGQLLRLVADKPAKR